MRQTIILLSLLVPLTLLTACSGNSKQKEEAKINAAVVAELGDVLKSDFNDAISRIDHSGMYSRDDVFGNSHDFTSKERALNYITSINGATLFVMDSLQLQIEEAAVNNESDRQLDKLNKLVKKYIDVCRHPAAAPDKLLKTCKSISDAIRETIKVAGNPDEKAVKDRLVVNFDCVSDGDHILIVQNSKAKRRAGAALREAFSTAGDKQPHLCGPLGAFYPSDQINFPCAVGVAAMNKSPILGLYMSRIHTPRDTICDERNFSFLVEGMRRFLRLYIVKND